MSRFRMMTINLTLLNFFYDGAEAIKHAFSISFWGKITLHTNTNVIKLKTWCYRAFRYNSWSDFGWVLEIENRNVQSHSMAKGNLNKTEKNQDQNYHSIKAYSLEDHTPKLNKNFWTKIYLVKATLNVNIAKGNFAS